MRLALLMTTALLALLLTLPVQAKNTHCASAKAQVAAMSAKLPIEVDAVTQTIKATASCSNKQLHVTRSIALKQSRMEADFKDFLQKQDDEFVCGDKNRRALLDADWKRIVDYKFQDGDVVKITVKCAK